jgi:hypothetical protein
MSLSQNCDWKVQNLIDRWRALNRWRAPNQCQSPKWLQSPNHNSEIALVAMSDFRLLWWLLEMATSEVRSQKSEVGSRKSEVGKRKSEVGTPEPWRRIIRRPNTCLFTHCVNDNSKQVIF